MTEEPGSRIVAPIATTSIGDFLFPAPAERKSGAILLWWEKRRLPFNLIVGGAGVMAVGIASLFSILPPNAPGFRFIVLPVVVYGVVANLCYSFGAVLEMALEKIFGRELLPAGPALFRAGLTFSVGLTLVFPTIIVVIGWILRVLGIVG